GKGRPAGAGVSGADAEPGRVLDEQLLHVGGGNRGAVRAGVPFGGTPAGSRQIWDGAGAGDGLHFQQRTAERVDLQPERERRPADVWARVRHAGTRGAVWAEPPPRAAGEA